MPMSDDEAEELIRCIQEFGRQVADGWQRYAWVSTDPREYVLGLNCDVAVGYLFWNPPNGTGTDYLHAYRQEQGWRNVVRAYDLMLERGRSLHAPTGTRRSL